MTRLSVGLMACFLALSPAYGEPQGSNYKYPRKVRGCPVHRIASGELVDCHGWRLGNGIGWDNSCLNLDYLPSMFACGGRGRR
jgi:hypothetical protein